MRYLLLTIALISSLFLFSCGGGGGGGSSDGATVRLKLNFENSKKSLNLFGKSGSLTIGNTEVTSVLLQYGKHGGSMSSLDVSNAVFNNNDVLLNGIEIGRQYDFYLSAYADGALSGSVLACQAASTGQTIADGVNIALNCTISNAKDISLMAENIMSVLKNASDAITSNGDPADMVNEMVTEYIAKDASAGGSFPADGHDGNDRETYGWSLVYWMLYQFYYPGSDAVTVVSSEIVESLSRSSVQSKVTGTEGETYAADLLVTFSNNGKIRLPMNFAYEDGKWKLSGNGRKYSAGLYLESVLFPDGYGKAEFYTGVNVYLNGEYLSEMNEFDGMFTSVDEDEVQTEIIDAQYIAFSSSAYIVTKKETTLATGCARVDDRLYPIEQLMTDSIDTLPEGSRFQAFFSGLDEYDNPTELNIVNFRTSADAVSVGNTNNTDFPHLYMASGSNSSIEEEISIKILKPTTGSEIAYYSIETGLTENGQSGELKLGPDETELNLNLTEDMNFDSDSSGYIAVSAVDIYERYYTVVVRVDAGRVILGSSQTRPSINNYDGDDVNGINGFYQYIDDIGDYNFSGLVNGKIFTSSNYNGTVDGYPYLLSYGQDEIETEKVYNSLRSDEGNSYNYSIFEFLDVNSQNYAMAMNYDGSYYRLSVGRVGGTTMKYSTIHYNSGEAEYLPMANIEFIDAVVNNNGNTIVAVVRGDKDVFSTGDKSTAIYLINTSNLSIQAVYGLEDFQPSAVTAEYDSTDFVLGGSYVDGGYSRATVLLVGSNGTVKSTVLVGAAIGGTEYDLTINRLAASDGSVYASGNLYDTGDSLGRVAVMKFNLNGNTLDYGDYIVYANAKYINTNLYGAEDIAVSRYTGTVTLAYITTDYKVTVNELDFSLKHRTAHTVDFCDNSQYRIQVTQAPYSSALVTGPGTLHAQNQSNAYINLDHFGNNLGGYVLKYSATSPTNDTYSLSAQGSVPTFTLYDMVANAGSWQTSAGSIGNSTYQEENSGSNWLVAPMIYMP